MSEFASMNYTHIRTRFPSYWNLLLDHGLEKTASYIIRVNGSTYEAINGSTGQIDYSGAVASTVIQSAINALTTGGELAITNGLYLITVPLYLQPYVDITGENKFTTELRTVGDIDLFHIYDTSFNRIRNLKLNCDSQTSKSAILIRNNLSVSTIQKIWFEHIDIADPFMGITDEQVNQVYHSIYFKDIAIYRVLSRAVYCRYATNIWFQDFVVDNSSGGNDGNPYFEISDTGALGGGYYLDHVSILSNLSGGIGFLFQHLLQMWMDTVLADECGGHGFRFFNCDEFYLTSCRSAWSEQQGYACAWQRNFIFNGCLAENNNFDGFGIAFATDMLFSSCISKNNGRDTTSGRAGFHLYNENSYVTFANCHAFDDQASGIQRYGFQENVVADNTLNSIVGGGVHGNVTAGVGVESATVKDVEGFVTEYGGSEIIASGTFIQQITFPMHGIPTMVKVTPGFDVSGQYWVNTLTHLGLISGGAYGSSGYYSRFTFNRSYSGLYSGIIYYNAELRFET